MWSILLLNCWKLFSWQISLSLVAYRPHRPATQLHQVHHHQDPVLLATILVTCPLKYQTTAKLQLIIWLTSETCMLNSHYVTVFFPTQNFLPSRRSLRTDIYPTDIISQWQDEWNLALVVNFSLIDDPTIWQLGFDLTTRYWALLNRFQTNQGTVHPVEKVLPCSNWRAIVSNAKLCHILSTAAHRPSWRVGCSNCTQLMMLPLKSWTHTARKCTRQQQ